METQSYLFETILVLLFVCYTCILVFVIYWMIEVSKELKSINQELIQLIYKRQEHT